MVIFPRFAKVCHVLPKQIYRVGIRGNNLYALSVLLSSYGLSRQYTPFRMCKGFGIPRVLSLYLFYLYVYTGVGRSFDWNNDRLLYQTMQGCIQFDVKFCRDMEYIPMLRILA